MACRGLEGLKVLIRELDEILRYRVEANLCAISEVSLIQLPAGHAMPCDEILTDQTEHISKQMHSVEKR